MKVLLVHRKGLFAHEGGEQNQVRQTAAELARRGVAVELCDSIPYGARGGELVHCFGLDPSLAPELERFGDRPRLLTPVFWDRAQGFPLDDLYDEWPRSVLDRIAYAARRMTGQREWQVARVVRRHFERALPAYGALQHVIDGIDLFLPNSRAEMAALQSFYVIGRPRHIVVPNAIDLEAAGQPSDFAERTLDVSRPFVLCSAGIDRRKNQYGLLKALLDSDVTVVLAGGIRERRYGAAVRRLAAYRGRTHLVGQLAPPDLHSLYRAAHVHALPSFHDTPGLSNLEAAAHGCVVVSTQIGGLREYLADHALYCNPFDGAHIREQVERALTLPRNDAAAALVRERYTYAAAVDATLAAYASVLESRVDR